MSGRLSKKRQIEIDAEINSILLSVDMTYPENGLQEIIESYRNIRAYEFDFEGDSNRICGAIRYDDEYHARIFINKALSPARKTFTLAHEFGHYILHPNQANFRLDYMHYDDSEESMRETEANYFAAVLLMPKERFIRIYNLFDNELKVAKYFGVSITAVRIRLQWI